MHNAKIDRTHWAASASANKIVPLDRVIEALASSEILAAAEGHVASLTEEEGAHWSDVDAWEVGALPQPPGFDLANPIDQGAVRAALAERIREVLGED